MTTTTATNSTRHHLLRACRLAPTALALAAASHLCAAQAQPAAGPTVPVSVVVQGLPAGLAPQLTSHRVMCNEGVSYLENPSQPLTEHTVQLPVRVTLPSGVTVWQMRSSTRYVGQLQLPHGPQPGDLPGGVATISCGSPQLGGLGTDQLRLGLRLVGLRAGLPGVLTMSLGAIEVNSQAPAPQQVNKTISAQTGTMQLPTAHGNALARGMQHRVFAPLASDVGTPTEPALSLQTVPPANGLALPRTLARLFLRSDGRGCVQAAGSTRCQGDEPGPLLHGGVLLQAVALRDGLARFSFELLQGFPVGPVRLAVSARSAELDSYLGASGPVVAPLRPWASRSVDLVVQ